jgi:hypothetical protein
MALGFPSGHLTKLLTGVQTGPAGTPAPAETPVMARLTRIEQKLDELLTLARADKPQGAPPETTPEPNPHQAPSKDKR